MSRKPRNKLNTSFFHVMAQGINKEKIFKTDQYKKVYLSKLSKNLKEYGLELVAYCIMDNHVHLLIYMNEQKNEILSGCMQKVNSEYAIYYNFKEVRVGHVFRNRFLSEPILDRKHLLNCIVYIHNNPVKANIIKNMKDYQHSSYNAYMNKKIKLTKAVIEILFGKEKIDLEMFLQIHREKLVQYFIDVDVDINEIIKVKIFEFIREKQMQKADILRDDEVFKKLITYIQTSNIKIPSTKIAKILNISTWKIRKLSK